MKDASTKACGCRLGHSAWDEESIVAQLAGLHPRLVSNDSQARETVAALLMRFLVRWLRHLYPSADAQAISDAATKTVLGYLLHPSLFRREVGPPLLSRLRWPARRCLADHLRGEGRRRQREAEWAHFTLAESTGCDPGAQGPATRVPAGLLARLRRRFQDRKDWLVFELGLEGERSLEGCARVLRISGLPVDEQRRVVKRAKHRVAVILSRFRRAEFPARRR